MSWKETWRTIFFPEFDSGGLSLTRDQVALRLFENAESPATTGTLAAAWTGVNVVVSRETTTPLNGEGSMKVVVAGGAGSVYHAFDRAKFGYPFPGHNSIRIRYIKLRATVDAGTETVRVTFGDVSDATHYRYWDIDVAQSKYTEFVIDMDPDNEESFPAPTEGATPWDPELIDRLGFTNLTDGRTFYFDDLELIFEYSLPDIIGFPTEAPVDMGDVGSLHARINGLWANVKALEGRTEQYSKVGPGTMEVGQNMTWGLELLSDFAPPTTTEIIPGNYQIDRVRHGVTPPTPIVALTPAFEAAGLIYADYQPQEDNWTEGDLLKVTFSGGYVRTDEEPSENVTDNVVAGASAVVTVDNAYQWQVGWLIHIHEGAIDEWATITSISSPTTFIVDLLANPYTVAAVVCRSILTDLETALLLTRISREPTEEFRSVSFTESDHEEADWTALIDTVKWDFQNYKVGGGVQAGDINSTVAGKVYLKVTNAGDYAARNKYTMYSKWFRVIADVDATFTAVGPLVETVGLAVFKGIAYDLNNHIEIKLHESSVPADMIRTIGVIGGASAAYEFNTVDDAVAFMIERQDRLWKSYYSLTKFPDYEWNLLGEWEDAADAFGEQTSAVLFVESGDVGSAAQGDFDNFKLFINSRFLEQIYNQSAIVPIVEKMEDPRVDQNTPNGIEIFRVGLMDTKNGLPTVAEITPGTTLVDRFREVTDADWANQAAETITNGELAGYINALYDFPNATWQPGDLARFRLTGVLVTDAATGRVYNIPDLSIYFVVGGPPNVNETRNLWLGDVIGNKWETPVPLMNGVPLTSGEASIEGYIKAVVSRGVAVVHGVVNIGVSSTTTIASDDLIGYGDSYFNTGYQMIVLKNVNSLAAAPEMEMRDITAYTSVTGTFVVEAFSAVVEAGDVILIVQNHLAVQVSAYGIADAGSDVDTIVDAARTEAIDYWNGMSVMMLSGAARGQVREIWDYAVGVIEVRPDFGGAVVASDVYAILTSNFYPLATVDAVANTSFVDVIGNKADIALYYPNDVQSIISRLRALRNIEIMADGLADVTSDASHLVDTLLTQGNDYWNGLLLLMLSGSNVGLTRPIVDFDAASDTATLDPAFPAAIALNDVYLILRDYSEMVPAADAITNYQPKEVVGNKADTPVPIMGATTSLAGYAKAQVARGMAILQATCNVGMVASTTQAVSDDMIGYGNDYFNNKFYLAIIKNANQAGVIPAVIPENEIRLITDYTSSSGTFVTRAFSANMEENDVFLVLHESLLGVLVDDEKLNNTLPADYDKFDVDDGTADTLRWASDYISAGAADGTATIAGGRLNLDITAAVVLAAAEYGVRKLQALIGRSWQHQADFNLIVANPNVNYVWAGLSVSAGLAWGANNYVRIYKRQDNVPNEGIAVEYRLAGGAVVTTSILVTTQDTMAFKIERIGNIWRCYYSLAIGSDHHYWVLALQIEDPTNAMTDTVSAYISVYNPEDAVGQQITAYVDDWEYFVGLGVLENILTHLELGGGALGYLGYCSPVMTGSATVIVCPNLAGFSDDAFNTGYQMVVLKNASVPGTSPEMERRDITDYVSVTGTFTTAAFSANIEANDIVLIVHSSVAAQVATYGLATGGTAATIVDTNRTEAADYWNGMLVIMLSGAAIGQIRPIYDFGAVANTINVAPNFGGAVVATDAYAILSQWVAVTGDTTAGNRLTSEVTGSKLDAIPAMNSAPADTSTLVSHVKAILERVGATPADPDDSLLTIAGQTDDAIPAMNIVPGNDSLVKQVKAILERIGKTPADPDDSLLETVGQRDDGITVAATATIISLLRNVHAALSIVAAGAGGGFEIDGAPGLVTALGTTGAVVADSATSVLGAIGANNAANAMSSAAVVADEDGSVLERLEDLKNGPEGVGGIYNIVSSLMLTGAVAGTVTAPDVAGTEIEVFSLVPGTVSKPLLAKIDVDNMVAGDTTILRVYYRFSAGGLWVQDDYQSYVGADGGLTDGSKIVTNHLDANPFGVRVTLAMTAGVARAYNWFAVYDN